ncbi:hypothetical protein CLV56_3349 [Mumia flava]|uniref:Uncharacterized protein n=1 Tax=Mumia flava TaxID=1348852 RepID=A0A2M9B7C2_9ACTN|nr:hypothetical protein CLV56_3349 [Mumia flava]
MPVIAGGGSVVVASVLVGSLVVGSLVVGSLVARLPSAGHGRRVTVGVAGVG